MHVDCFIAKEFNIDIECDCDSSHADKKNELKKNRVATRRRKNSIGLENFG